MDDELNNESFDLESILAEYHGQSAPASEVLPPPPPPPPAETDAAPEGGVSHRLVMRSMSDAFGESESESQDGAAILTGGVEDGTEAETETAAKTPLSELELQALVDSDEAAQYAAADAAEAAAPEAPEDLPPAAPDDDGGRGEASSRKQFLSPFLALMTLIALRRERRASGERRRPTVELPGGGDELPPEPDPEKATRFYSAQMRSLRLRGRLSAGVCLVMLYLSFAWSSAALPLFGPLGRSVRVISLLLLILELTVAMLGLDVFTGGLLGVARRRMGAESLVAVSCLLSMLDAVVLAILNDGAYGIPFCAVSATSLCFAVWGAYYTCKGRRTAFRMLYASKTPFTVTAEQGLARDDVALLKSSRPTEGFIRRSEEADAGEYAYGLLTPFLLAAAVALGLLASLVHGHYGAIVHCISVLVAAGATFSCAICFAIPFASAARKLSQSGAAIAGWAGLRDAGGSRYVVITDRDVFPRGTVEIDKIRILEGTFTDKVLAYTSSVISASGSELASPFTDLIRRNGYSMHKVESFTAHDGGGMTAIIGGEMVHVGGAGFMNLMGIRLPQKLSARNSVFSAINGSLVGIFTLEYHPTAAVQDALVTLLHTKLEPVFAIRDFNITPTMIKTKFKLPTDSFKFPPYAERYRISAAEPDNDSRVAAVIVRDGMGPLVEVAERGHRASLGVRAATAISVAGSVFGVVLMFLLCWIGAFDSASAANVITFMLLWLIPIALIIVGLER